MMPSASLDTGDDLAELAEFLRFLSDWLAATMAAWPSRCETSPETALMA